MSTPTDDARPAGDGAALAAPRPAAPEIAAAPRPAEIVPVRPDTAVPGEIVTPPVAIRPPAASRPNRVATPRRDVRDTRRSESQRAGRRAGLAATIVRGGLAVREAAARRAPASLAIPLRAFAERSARRRSAPTRHRTPVPGVGRMLCWQLAAVVVVASVGAPRSVTAAAVAAAVGAVALTTVRINGRLLYQWIGSAWRYALRPHRAVLEPGDLAAQDLVDLVADHGRVETIDIEGIPVAFIHQSEGVAAVLELHAARDPGDPAWRTLLSVSSLLPPPDAETPPFSAQLIMQTTPPADLNGLRGDLGVPTRQAWVTVQALRTPDVHESADLSLALSNAVQRMIRRLAREDIPTRALDREETLALVTALAQLDADEQSPAVRVEETWSTWSAGDTVQACFRIDGWQEADNAARQRILRRLDLIPSRGTTVAIAARRRDRNPDGAADCRVTVRITERDRPRLENSASLLGFALEDLPQTRPERLDGDHLAALAASLPLGAGASIR